MNDTLLNKCLDGRNQRPKLPGVPPGPEEQGGSGAGTIMKKMSAWMNCWISS